MVLLLVGSFELKECVSWPGQLLVSLVLPFTEINFSEAPFTPWLLVGKSVDYPMLQVSLDRPITDRHIESCC